jgi:hypothetical protein
MPNYFDYISESAAKYDEPEFIEEEVTDSFNETIADMDLYCFQESLVVAGVIVGIAALIGLLITFIKKIIDHFSTSTSTVDKKVKELEKAGVNTIATSTERTTTDNKTYIENGTKYVNKTAIEYVDFSKGEAQKIKNRINELFENTTLYLTLVITSGTTSLHKISDKMGLKENDQFVSYTKKDGAMYKEGTGADIGRTMFVPGIFDKWIGDYKKCVSTTDKMSIGTLHTINRSTKDFIGALKKDQRELSKLQKEVEGRSRSGSYNQGANDAIKEHIPTFRKNMAKITNWYTNIDSINNKLAAML